MVILSCDDLRGYVVDEELFIKALEEAKLFKKVDVLSWNADVDWSEYDVALIRTTWDYTKNRENFLKALKSIEDSGCRLMNSFKTVEWNSDKTYLHELSQKGLPVVPSLFLEKLNIEQALLDLEKFESDKFVIKPTVGASAEGILVLNKEDLSVEIKKRYDQKDLRCFIQPFLDNILQGEVSYFFYNGEFQYAVRKLPKKGDFRVQEEHGGLITEHSPQPFEIDKAVAIQKEAGDVLYARVDAVFSSESDWMLMELELIEPSMYFNKVPCSAQKFVKALQKAL